MRAVDHSAATGERHTCGDGEQMRLRARGVRAGARLAVAALLAGTAACGTRPTAADPAPTVSRSAAKPVTRIMIMGDSLTQETAGDYTWRYRLAAHLSLSAPGQVDFVGDRSDVYDYVADRPGSHDYAVPLFDSDHHAKWGDAIRLEAPAVEAVLRAIPADVLVVGLGANDLTYWTSPQQTITLMRTFVDNARRANPRIKMVIGHVVTRWDAYTNSVTLTAAHEYNDLLDAAVLAWSTPLSPVVAASTDIGWNPKSDTWDGSHPSPTGEMIIARGYANALHALGVGGVFGPLYGEIPWPAKGQKPSATRVGARAYRLTWPPTVGAADYYLERRDVTAGQQTWDRLPGRVTGTQWTTESLAPGTIYAYRVVPFKYWLAGQPGPQVDIAVPGHA